MEPSETCQYFYQVLVNITSPDPRRAVQLRRYWWALKKSVWYLHIFGFFGFAERTLSSTRLGRFIFKEKGESFGVNSDAEASKLQPGEWVEIKSAKEVFATLDRHSKLRGLPFTPEMMKFCGNRMRVYKRIEKIILESTGELRKIMTPTVLLEGVLCDGKAHGGCDRSCYCFWREAWLRRMPLLRNKEETKQS